MNAALGQFADGFNGFRRMLAAVPPGSRLLLFQNACKEAAAYVGKGLDRVVAADELTDMALANGHECIVLTVEDAARLRAENARLRADKERLREEAEVWKARFFAERQDHEATMKAWDEERSGL